MKQHALLGALLGLTLVAFCAIGCHKDEEQHCDGGTPAGTDAACDIQVGTQCFQSFGNACSCAGCPGNSCALNEDVPAAIYCQ